MVPARTPQALSPWLFGLALDRWGAGALAVSATVGVLALLALFMIPSVVPDDIQAKPQPARPPRGTGRVPGWSPWTRRSSAMPEKDEHEEPVGDGIEERTELARQPGAARQPAIEKIRQRRDAE